MGRAMKTGKGAGIAQAFARTMGVINIDPAIIRYTHSRIRPRFSGCGRLIEQTLADISEGRTKVSDLPMIQVVLAEGGHVFSLNNRRLYVLKRLREKGLLPGNQVTVRTRPGRPKELERFTVENCSLRAKILREKHNGRHPEQSTGKDHENSLDNKGGVPTSSTVHQSAVAPGQHNVLKKDETVTSGVEIEDSFSFNKDRRKIVGVKTDDLSSDIVHEHKKRVEQLLEGVEMDDDL